MSAPQVDRQALLDVPTLATERLVLVPLGPEHTDAMLASFELEDAEQAESARLTGTHATFTREQVLGHLSRVRLDDGRADWAVLRDGVYVGEVVLNDLDSDNAAMNFRIDLSLVAGQGYGAEVTRAVVRHGLDQVGLHRISLEVYAFNARARTVYERCGFVVEGTAREALWWDGAWHDAVLMAVLADTVADDETAQEGERGGR